MSYSPPHCVLTLNTHFSHFPSPCYFLPHLTDHQQAIQWFGIDVGGTLVKAVYYETQNDKTDPLTEGEGVAAMKKFIKSNLKYGSTGIRDQRLEMHGQKIGGYTGTLHFIKFATNRMCGFFDMATNNGLARFPKVVCATGGGAFKFESAFQEVSFVPTSIYTLTDQHTTEGENIHKLGNCLVFGPLISVLARKKSQSGAIRHLGGSGGMVPQENFSI